MVKISKLENIYSLFALLFFSGALAFESLFAKSEGELGSPVPGYNPLSSLLSLWQHGIFLLALALLVLRWRKTLSAALRNKFIWFLIALIITSYLWSDFPDFTQRRSLALLETTTFGLYLASRYSLKTQLKFTAMALGIAAVLSLLFTLALPGRGIESGVHAGAWRGIFIQKNIFARLMVLSSIVFLVVTPENRKQRYLIWSSFGLSIGLILLTTSKTALALSMILLLMFPLYQAFRWRFTLATPFVLSVVLVVASTVTWVLSNAERIVSSAGRDLTLSGRTIIWSALIDKIQERPWLGYGYMGFWHGIYGQSAYVGKVYGTTYIPPHSHNGFLELALAFGFVGVLFFVLSFISIARRGILSARLTKAKEGLWPLMYLSFLILYNQTESTLVEHNSIFWVLYVSLALSKFIPARQTD
ncbi:MAG: O-antigen ligase [Oscillatoria sp. PMC 1051.18]|nr:O-antigen ligase [Oscillatoria sp. PMC 1050.18]MEC5030105.1 O-antigen ligase [Oscillatoria sp. PMC 1051.18]